MIPRLYRAGGDWHVQWTNAHEWTPNLGIALGSYWHAWMRTLGIR